MDKRSPEKGQMSWLKLWRPGRGGADDTVPELPTMSMDRLALVSLPSICMFHPCLNLCRLSIANGVLRAIKEHPNEGAESTQRNRWWRLQNKRFNFGGA